MFATRPLVALLAALLMGACGNGVSEVSTTDNGPRLTTRWTDDISPDRVLPEYPRPQMVRSAWVNLNGTWEYAIHDSEEPRPESFDGPILVPFPVESYLSGVTRAVTAEERLWYRRTFRLAGPLSEISPDPGPDDPRLLLQFGAVDWHATVYVNGQEVGQHRGGYDPFSFDITGALVEGEEQEVVVGVWDPTNEGYQPRGKQVLEPGGIWYTAVTGIWQTVWLEPVPARSIAGLQITPDVDAETLTLQVDVTGGSAGIGGRGAQVMVEAVVLEEGSEVARSAAPPGTPLILPVPGARLWSPDDPFLYDLRVSLATDTVESYFGMRKISVDQDIDGINRLFLNNEPLFHYGPLDQGWWPDGLYTAPTDEALIHDIEITKRLGFNTARKHVKVEAARWYYHCDRLGLLVWQDMPNGNNEGPEGEENFTVEMDHIVDALYSHPSIVMWVPFNEGWGQHDTERYTAWLQERDPSRLVNNASGWTDRGVGHVLDIHRYPGPGMPPLETGRAAVLGEFGGLGLPMRGHLWLDRDNWGYRSYESGSELGDAYAALIYQLRPLIGEGLAAAIYTQTTDVEIEVNGLMTYDREEVKMPRRAMALNELLYETPPSVVPVLPTSREAGQRWRYTTAAPEGEWSQPGFDDSGWRSGLGGFGTERTPGAVVRTRWDTEDIWLRRTFQLSSTDFESLHLRIHHDEDAEVYLNGHPIGAFEGYTAGYAFVPLTEEARQALRTGTNTLAVHVTQTDGGQYIDLGLVDLIGM